MMTTEPSETDRDAMQRAYNAMCSAEYELGKVTRSVVIIGMGALLLELSSLRYKLGMVAYPTEHSEGRGDPAVQDES